MDKKDKQTLIIIGIAIVVIIILLNMKGCSNNIFGGSGGGGSSGGGSSGGGTSGCPAGQFCYPHVMCECPVPEQPTADTSRCGIKGGITAAPYCSGTCSSSTATCTMVGSGCECVEPAPSGDICNQACQSFFNGSHWGQCANAPGIEGNPCYDQYGNLAGSSPLHNSVADAWCYETTKNNKYVYRSCCCSNLT